MPHHSPAEHRVPRRRPTTELLSGPPEPVLVLAPIEGAILALGSAISCMGGCTRQHPPAPANQPACTRSGIEQPAKAGSASISSSGSISSTARLPIKRVLSTLSSSFAPQGSCGTPPVSRAVRRRGACAISLGPDPCCSYGGKALDTWDLDFTEADTEQMIQMCHDMFALSGVVDHFDLDPATLGSFFAAVASHYRDVPYHNLNHAVHVLHGTWMVLQCPSAARLLSWEDRLSLLVAALVHDLDHDGHSNSYHTHMHSDLARQYDNRSVLENHHCAVAFEVMGKENCALLDGLGSDLAARLRKSIADAILGTDMSNHFTMMRELCMHVAEFDPASESDRRLLCSVILHAADIGAGVRPFHINDVHSRRVRREFHVLAEEEARLGIPVTLAIDSSDPSSGAQAEVCFLSVFVLPLWEHLAVVIPELAPALVTLKSNREQYALLAGSGDKALS